MLSGLSFRHHQSRNSMNISENIEQLPKSRSEAIARGEKFYLGSRCARGHVAARRVYNHECLACRNADRRARYHASKRNDELRRQLEEILK
jgi:hypothetical protein